MTDPDPCSCFKSVPPVQSECKEHAGIAYSEAQKDVKRCKKVFGKCTRIMKLLGPYMDQCRCDCVALTTAAPGRVKRDLLLQL